jgi:hypothetical protein
MKASLYFILILFLILYLLSRRQQLRTDRVIRVSIRYFMLWIGIVLLELAILFMFPGSWGQALLPLFFVLVCSLLLYRKKREKLIFTTYILLLMCLLSLVSVV